MSNTDTDWMQLALDQARTAAGMNEVPVGAVLVDADGQLLAAGHNQPISSCDPSAHAEIITLRAAALKLNNYRLPNTTLYVTLEPCTMCVGALVHARIKRLVYAASEPRSGAIESAQQLFATGDYNHRPEVEGGLLAAESSALLTVFFKARRR
jgi:tRNA(adenine34) deaminase